MTPSQISNKCRAVWGRITGADKGKQYPEQQGVSLDKLGDYTIVYPAGYYHNANAEQLFVVIAPGVAMPVTVNRPKAAQGESVFFHPGTNSRIIAKNNGDLEIDATEAEGSVTLKGVQVNVEASDSCNVSSPLTNLGDGGAAIARLGDEVQVEVTSGSSAGIYTGTIISAGSNTSI